MRSAAVNSADSSNTIELVEESDVQPCTGRQRISFGRRVHDLTYDNKLFDNVDSRIRSYLDKQKLNYEKALVKLYKLEGLKSEKAKRLLNELNASRRQQFSAVRQSKSMQRVPQLGRERNNSLPNNKQMQLDLHQIQEELRRINPEIQPMNVSRFKFSQSHEARLDQEQWERVAIQGKIRPKLTNFQEELNRLNTYFTRNENSLNQLMQIQKDLMHYQLLQK